MPYSTPLVDNCENMVNPDPPRRTRDQGRENQPRMNTDGHEWGSDANEEQPFQLRMTRMARMGTGDDHGSRGFSEKCVFRPEIAIFHRKTAQNGVSGGLSTKHTKRDGFWIGCSPGRLPARLWRDPGAVFPRRGRRGLQKRSEWSRHDLVPVWMLPPAQRAGLQRKIASIRVHPCPFAVENARFSGWKSRFHRKSAPHCPTTAFSDPFHRHDTLRFVFDPKTVSHQDAKTRRSF